MSWLTEHVPHAVRAAIASRLAAALIGALLAALGVNRVEGVREAVVPAAELCGSSLSNQTDQ